MEMRIRERELAQQLEEAARSAALLGLSAKDLEKRMRATYRWRAEHPLLLTRGEVPLDCGNCLSGLRWQSGFHPCEEALASRDNECAVDLDVELTRLPADYLDVGVEPSPKLFAHCERPVPIAEADGAIPDRDLHGLLFRRITDGGRPRFPRLYPMR